MNALMNLLNTSPTLIVSLPSNSLELAKAAVKAGADVLKVHIHVHHEASGTKFGSLAEEREVLQRIVALGAPTAIVIGAGDDIANPEEMERIQQMGFQAFDAYAHYLPPWMYKLTGIAKMAAVDNGYSPEAARDLQGLGMDILEAAIVPSAEYGQPMQPQDLVAYKALRAAVSVPIVVPTQRKIRVEDVPALFDGCEINALMIGAIVTGSEAKTIFDATKRFKQALNDLMVE